jgi:hypothetical protein
VDAANAKGLTDSGLITGSGFYDEPGLPDGGGGRACVLDASALIPEPGCLSLLGALGLELLRRRHAIHNGAV